MFRTVWRKNGFGTEKHTFSVPNSNQLVLSRTLPPDTSDGVAECVTTFGLKEEGGI